MRSQFFTAKLVDLTTFSVVNYTGALSAPDRKKKWEDIGTLALRQNDLGNDDIKQLVRHLAIPSMLAQFVNVLYSIVDRMYIGNIKDVGEIALAGAGVCGPIVTLISSFAFLIGIVFFHELPDWIAIAGGCLLIAAGILNFISGREAQRRLSDDT